MAKSSKSLPKVGLYIWDDTLKAFVAWTGEVNTTNLDIRDLAFATDKVDVSGSTVETELTTADLDTGGGTDTRAVVGMVLAESGGGILVGSANPLPVRVKNISATPTESSVGDSITSVTLLAANTSRSEVYILNDSTATLRISLSSTATSSSPYILRAGEGLAIRSNADGKVYMGIVSGIWDSAPGGYARVVEFI